MTKNRYLDGLERSRETICGLEVDWMNITTQAMALQMGKPIGGYAAIHTGRLKELTNQEPAVECLAECLRRFLEPYLGKKLLIAGVGNADLVHDRLGPEVVRHIPAYLLSEGKVPCAFESVSLLIPGVRYYTNVNTGTVISGMVRAVDAACVLLIDTSAAVSFERMSETIELSSGGLKLEGSGEWLTEEVLGVPVVAVSVPLLLMISPVVVRMMKLKTAKDGILLMDTNITEDLKTAVTVASGGILRVLYPELDLERLCGII